MAGLECMAVDCSLAKLEECKVHNIGMHGSWLQSS